MLDLEGGPSALIGKLRKLASFEPELGDVLKNIADAIAEGKISKQILSEVAAFASFRLHVHMTENKK
jgi:hypothetical protein